MSAYAGYLVETFVTLGAVCALAVLVLWGARRVGFARATGPIELRGYLPLDARRAIYLVKVGEQVFVLGVGDGGFTKLGEIADRDLPTGAAQREPSAFARVLARMAATDRPGATARPGTARDARVAPPTGSPLDFPTPPPNPIGRVPVLASSDNPTGPVPDLASPADPVAGRAPDLPTPPADRTPRPLRKEPW